MKTTKIIGPPGTGKTRRLMAILDTLLKQGIEPAKIAFLTHTNAAAEVVAQRAAVKGPWFRTLHSACVKRLDIGRENIVDPSDYREFTRETGMKIISEKDDGLTEDGGFYVSDNFAPVLRAYDFSRLTGTPLGDVCATMPVHPSLKQDRRDYFLEEWELFKTKRALFDFTDMLKRYYESDIGPVPCTHFILDEAQDLSWLQWLVFKKFSRDAEEVYAAGDDDQAIYGFMGGSEFGFFEFAADETEVLRKSHRVPIDIGERADRIIRRIAQRTEKHTEWKQEPGTVQHVMLGSQSLPWRQWLDQNKSVLVLARHRRGASSFSRDLQQIGVAHALGKMALQQTALAKAMQTYILMRRGERVTWRAALKMFERAKNDVCADGVRIEGRMDKDATVSSVPYKFAWDDPEYPLLFADNKYDINNARQIERIINEEGVEVIGTDPLVQVMTMHAAKGREADIVVIVPDCNETVRKNLDTPSEIRLAYVALTRARELVFVLAPQSDRWITHLTAA